LFDDLPLRKNLLANFAGRLWASGISLVFIPLYIRFMGIESYGLIGVYLSLMALVSVLDMGLSTTLNRELARLSTVTGNEQEARNLVRSMEAIYWGIGLLVALATILLAPLVPRYWVNPKGISAEIVQRAVMIMGFVIAFDWPAALYTGGLMGLQRQVQLNSIRAGMGTLQAVGAVLILWLVSPTISAYFLWQIFIAAAQTTTLAVVLWRNLPRTYRKARFQYGLLTKNWKFTAGVSGIAVLATILTQADKVILAKMLSLEAFGYYVLAYNVASSLTLFTIPMFSAFFPKLSQLFAEKKESELSTLYHKGCQFLSILTFSLALTLAFFSRETLQIWIRDAATVERTHLLLSVVVVGTALNALMILPYTIQMAFGWTRLILFQNTVALLLLVPAMFLMIGKYGAIGAAIVWVVLNVAYVLFLIPLMHSRLLRGEMSRWYISDVGIPLLIILAIVLPSKWLLPAGISHTATAFWIVATAAASFLAPMFVCVSPRKPGTVS
jgi:O-antigen/teichoic acid export membrane protein